MMSASSLSDKPATCLVLRALYLGDLLTGLPALSMVRNCLPQHRIVLAAPVTVGTLAVRAGVVDALLPSLELASLTSPAVPSDIDIAIDLYGNGPASRDLLAVHHPRRLIAYAGSRVPWRQDEHEVTRWCRLIADAFDISPPWPGMRGLLPMPHRPIDGSAGAVVIHPGAKSAARRWPADRYADVARFLVSAGEEVVVTGGPGEEALAGHIAAETGARTRLGMSLDGLCEIVAAARLVLCGDTGVGHLAAAFGTPSVHLFGPIPPAEWGPPPDGPHSVIYHGRPGYRGDPHGETPDPALLDICVKEVQTAAAIRLELTTSSCHA
jgi:ADP-heptose:LPS heptosyltransferase